MSLGRISMTGGGFYFGHYAKINDIVTPLFWTMILCLVAFITSIFIVFMDIKES